MVEELTENQIKTKKYLESLTEEQMYELNLKFLRMERNNLLEKTDAFMSQFDRFSQTQQDELKIYRQKLRDMTIDYKEVIGKEFIKFPDKPIFLK